MIIAIDSTLRGPALGGCRWKPYPDSAAARRDVQELARAMTRKAALARLDLGGGKAVVVGDPRTRTREQLLAFGDFVQSLEGRYITAADMGSGEEQMAVIGERTRHVCGLPVRLGGAGDPGPFTALGVKLALDAALAQFGKTTADAHVAIQGVGSVGGGLLLLLLEDGARVTVADPKSDLIDAVLRAHPGRVESVELDQITRVSCDVFAPCGPPAVIDSALANAIPCQIVCGGANNPLANLDVAAGLAARDVLYVPDFLANAGGLIHLACALEGGDADATRARLRVIPENLDEVLAYAKREAVNTAQAAEALARISQYAAPAS
ncbi:MAG: Glu/Leu/Phe/Val dehydrogenase [bacterium]|nr:Glu/Leu/Phe/Val dehydrogenase [bacterium]